ncbi:methyltransferase domain-containing protein [Hyphomonas sp.]|uniref:class I SAM-dependent methyltransferase n=1 Tax=Hyphomonas sp. TaxID=87 RepID=UPI00391AD1D4
MPSEIRQALMAPIRKIIPYQMRRTLWGVIHDIRTLPERVKPDAKPVPWRFVHDVGDGEFHQVGAYYLNELTRLAGLAPQHHVLDIGCGTGRVAFPLAGFLSREGLYTGFDISAGGLAWMIRHLPPSEAGFRICRADIRNTEYRPQGAVLASNYRFPVSGSSVDVAFATSVFTHLLPLDSAAYLAELGRTLKPGGRAYVTAFPMTEARWKRAGEGQSYFPFQRYEEGAYVASPDVPEATIAFDERLFLDWIAAAGLELDRPIEWGGWCKETARGFQDVLILKRPD